MEYDAWGRPIFKQASSAAEAMIMTMIIGATNVAYRGYFYDFDTGLYYLRSRYYDPETGRFINADDTAYLGADNSPLSMNLFAYCENNPVNGVDHSGYWNQYSVSKAVAYARKYAKFPNIKSYHYYPSGDCVNFVSQCLHAGGIPMVSGQWFCYQRNKYRSNSWTLLEDQIIFFGSQYFKFNRGGCFFDPSYLDNYKKAKKRQEAEKLVSMICKYARAGDVMYFDLKIDGKENYSHAVFITYVNKTSLQYCAHTSARLDYPLVDTLVNSTIERIFIINIRGYAI